MRAAYTSDIQQTFSNARFDGKMELNCPMSRYTTFKIGGAAQVLLEAAGLSDIQTAVDICKTNGHPFFIMGNGSNLLVRDCGYDGVIIRLGSAFSEVSADGCVICAKAGALLPQIANFALSKGLSGFEFAAGIPGSAGGALVMNAGAYGGEMADIVRSAKVLRNGRVIELSEKELELGYRHSALIGSGDIALELCYELVPGNTSDIKSRMDELREARSSKQPLNLPSAGSAFKRPEGAFAAKLIDDCGLKGFSVGGAQVSQKHAGFVVNAGGATAADVIALTDIVIEKVRRETGYLLEREFIII